jgi:hypothetical protein
MVGRGGVVVTAIEPDKLRASDAEREHAVQQLNVADSEGRVSDEEFGQRVSDALVARTRADLARLVADLPPQQLAPSNRPLSKRVAAALASCLCCGSTPPSDRDVDERQVRT